MPDLVLEFIEGGDLLEYIIKHGGLNEAVTSFLARQLCESLKVCVFANYMDYVRLTICSSTSTQKA